MSNISIRFTKKEDQKEVSRWFMEPGILRWFPMCNLKEVNDSVNIWFSYIPYKASLTALYDGIVCGAALLYLQPYKKLAHQSLFVIIVDEQYRNKGVGKRLLEELSYLAKERFNLEFLHLEVYHGNPAISLYKRFGFIEYGVHKRFLKEEDGAYRDKIMMRKYL